MYLDGNEQFVFHQIFSCIAAMFQSLGVLAYCVGTLFCSLVCLPMNITSCLWTSLASTNPSSNHYNFTRHILCMRHHYLSHECIVHTLIYCFCPLYLNRLQLLIFQHVNFLPVLAIVGSQDFLKANCISLCGSFRSARFLSSNRQIGFWPHNVLYVQYYMYLVLCLLMLIK